MQPQASPGQPFPGITPVVGAGGGKKEEEEERTWVMSTGSSGLTQGTRQESLGTYLGITEALSLPPWVLSLTQRWERRPTSHLRESWAANQETEKCSFLSVVIG